MLSARFTSQRMSKDSATATSWASVATRKAVAEELDVQVASDLVEPPPLLLEPPSSPSSPSLPSSS